MFSAFWIKRWAPVICWRVRERVWVLKRAGKRLERKIEVSGDFLAKWS